MARSPLRRRRKPLGAPVVAGVWVLRPAGAPPNLALQRTRPQGAFRECGRHSVVAGPLSFVVRRLGQPGVRRDCGIRRRRYQYRSVPCCGRRRCPVSECPSWRGRRCAAVGSRWARPSSLACGSCGPPARRLTWRFSGPGHRARFGSAVATRLWPPVRSVSRQAGRTVGPAFPNIPPSRRSSPQRSSWHSSLPGSVSRRSLPRLLQRFINRDFVGWGAFASLLLAWVTYSASLCASIFPGLCASIAAEWP